MNFIADEKILYHSPDPMDLYAYTPALAHGFQGRILASFDLSGPGLTQEKGARSSVGDYSGNQLRIYLSDDAGENWRECSTRLPMLHARIFAAGDFLYALGHAGKLLISKSSDNGESWSDPAVLNDTARWHQSAGSLEHANGNIYLTMENPPETQGWAGGNPVFMAARETDDLTDPGVWRYSNRLDFSEVSTRFPGFDGKTPHCWLESSVVRQRDEKNLFFDPSGRTFLVFLRVNGSSIKNVAAVLRASERADGSLALETLKMPTGENVLYVPFPGGYMKFQILWDEPSRRYWLIASQPAFSSFANPDALSNDVRWFDERTRLELFYSKNLFDWCSAGLVAARLDAPESRHYASLLAVGNDLLVLSRSSDPETKNAHDTDMITLHRVAGFRDLAY